MKKNIFFALILTLTGLTSCKKYLDTLPDQRTQLNSPEKVSELLVTAYPYGNYLIVAEAMSDNAKDVSVTGEDDIINRNAYFWRDQDNTAQDSPEYYWNGCYFAIAAANLALETCNNAANPEDYTAQKGEALLCRAYAHFMLVTLFSKSYNPATASNDAGIPYVTEPETVVAGKYLRETVKYVYEQIEKDLIEGLPLIKDDAYKVPSFHFTKRAAHAFAARFYLFKQDPDKVVEHANRAFPNNDFAQNFRPWLEWQNFSSSAEYRLANTSSTNPGNLLLCETISWAGRYLPRYRYALDQNLYNQILSPLGRRLNVYPSYSYSSTFYFAPKLYEHFKRNSVNASTGRGYNMVALLTTEEVLLNRAEAYIKKDQLDLALADMNTLISKRMINYTPAIHNFTEEAIVAYYDSSLSLKEAYLNALLDLKRAEFVGEGMRWLDIKRLGIPVVHTYKTNTIPIEEKVIELPANDLRRELQLPSEVTLSGVEPNPR